MVIMLLLPSSFSRGCFVVNGSDDIVVDDENYDDIVVDVSVGSVDDGGASHGLRFFCCHYRGNGSRQSRDLFF